MFKRIGLAIALLLIIPLPVLAQGPVQPPTIEVAGLLPAALLLFLPIGLILLISSAMPEDRAPAAAINLLGVWAVAVLAYFAAGFALNFGGVAQVIPHPDLAGLYWEWYPFDPSVDADVARLWGIVALRGWGLSGEAATTGALLLFLAHASMVGAAAMIPAGVLIERGRSMAAIWAALLMGLIVYPIAGNWVWGGGWLSNLGASLNLGHGFVDFGGAGVLFLSAAGMALAALLFFRPASPPVTEADQSQPLEDPNLLIVAEQDAALEIIPMPSAYLPVLSMLGSGWLLVGWFGLSTSMHNPTAVNFSPVYASVAGLLAILIAGLAAAGYSWFTTRHLDPLMTSRGVAAGLVVATAGAPFIPLWMLLAAGLVMGFMLPPLIYFFDRWLRLFDKLGTLTTFGVSPFVSLLLAGFVADGHAGQGWNRIGLLEYQGVSGQGVSGAVVAAGYVADWPGQIQAQLLGSGAILLWSLLASAVLFQIYLVVAHAWGRTKDEQQDVLPEADIEPDEVLDPVDADDLPAEDSSGGLLRRLKKT